MRIAAVFEPNVPNIFYRAVEPVMALGDRGHDVRLVELKDEARLDAKALRGCDVVHLHRISSEHTLGVVDQMLRRGTAVTWDNDDDIRLLPAESPFMGQIGAQGAQRIFATQKKMLRRAHVVTTASDVLADRFRRAGAEEVRVIENHPADYQHYSGGRRGDDVVVGWIAGFEHLADANALDLAGILQRLMDRHPTLRVVTVGLRLPLEGARYEHRPPVPFSDLHMHIRQFDIGIAPLSEPDEPRPLEHQGEGVRSGQRAVGGVGSRPVPGARSPARRPAGSGRRVGSGARRANRLALEAHEAPAQGESLGQDAAVERPSGRVVCGVRTRSCAGRGAPP